MNDKELLSLLLRLKQSYYLGTPEVSDVEYDELEKTAVDRGLTIPVGYEITKGKIDLPCYLPSLDKTYADGTGVSLPLWLSKREGNLVVQYKMDGITALLIGDKLYTRGDGRRGRDVSYLLPYLELPPTERAIRGELVLPSDIPNSRNVVAGIFNRTKNVDIGMVKQVTFLAYELVGSNLPHLEQMRVIENEGFDIVWTRHSPTVTLKQLKSVLARSKGFDYPVDGLVLTDSYPYPYVTERNPSYKLAFKNNDDCEGKVVKVKAVEWSLSQYGRLNPKIIFDPVELDSAKISKATCHNARFVLDNGIGEGAIVRIIRSGTVIPKVTKVIKGVKAVLPEGEWDANEVFLYQREGEGIDFKRLVYFFTKIDTTGVKEGTLKRLYDAGFTTIRSVLEAQVEDLVEIDGIGEKKATAIVENVKSAYKSATLTQIMIGSSLFQGLGTRRINTITQKFDIFDHPTVEQIVKMEGFQEKTALLFTSKLDSFVEWLKKLPKKEWTSVPTSSLIIAMTGKRDREIERWVKDNGVTVLSSVPKTKKIDVCVASDPNSGSAKLKVAKHRGIPILTPVEFKKEYMN